MTTIPNPAFWGPSQRVPAVSTPPLPSELVIEQAARAAADIALDGRLTTAESDVGALEAGDLTISGAKTLTGRWAFEQDKLILAGDDIYLPGEIVLDATRLAKSTGAGVNLLAAGKIAAWQFGPSSDNSVAAWLQLPRHWTAINVDARWCAANSDATADVVMRLDTMELDQGLDADFNGPVVSSANIIATTRGLNLAVVSVLVTNLPVDTTKLFYLRMFRLGTHASDTFTGSSSLVDLTISKAA